MSKAVSIGEEPRGEDFTHKFRKGEWAETLLLQTLNSVDELQAIHYGVSRDDTLYTKADLDAVKEPGVTEYKRPDILVFNESDLRSLPNSGIVSQYHNASPRERSELLPELEATGVLETAVMAIEAEASRFNVSERPGNYQSLSAYVKCEDYPRLASWCVKNDTVPLFVCQLFFDRGYIIPFRPIETHADQLRNGDGVSVPGFVREEIPGIWKDGYCVSLQDYPGAIELGEITSQPRVVREFDNEKYDVEYTWTRGGRLDAEKNDPHFHGGEFTDEAIRNLARYASN